MKSKLVAQIGEPSLSCWTPRKTRLRLTAFAGGQGITGASLTAGRFPAGDGRLARSKSFREIPVDEQCGMPSAIGDIAVDDKSRASLHVHSVLGLN